MIEEYHRLGVKHGPKFNSTVSQLCLGESSDLPNRKVIIRTAERRETKVKDGDEGM